MRHVIFLVQLPLLLVACAPSTPPVTAERRAGLMAAAQSCQRKYPYVDQYEVDRFGEVTAWYRMSSTMRGNLQPFFTCVQAQADSPAVPPRTITKQEREDGRGAVDRAKAEAYRRIDEPNEQGAPPVTPTVASSGATATVATARTPGPIVEILTNESILGMLKGGLDESAILTQIATTSARFDTRPEALVVLKQEGVSARILEAMIAKR